MKILAEHRFWIELLREPSGELLARVPFEGLERLAAEARYEAAARGELPDEPARLTARCAPLVHAPGVAGLAGIRVDLVHEALPETVLRSDYPCTVAATRGHELGSELTAEGVLREGDGYRVRLVSGPRPAAAGGEDDPPASEVFETPFPVRPGGLGPLVIGPEAVAACCPDRPVFIARDVLAAAAAEAVRHGHLEVGTVLLGSLVEDVALREAGCRTSWAVVVTGQVPVDDGHATAASFTFPPEAFRRARSMAGLRGRDESVVGTQHSHGWTCPNCAGKREINNLFFSTEDERMTHHFPAYGVFLVVGGDPERSRDHPVANLYTRLRGTIHTLPYGTF